MGECAAPHKPALRSAGRISPELALDGKSGRRAVGEHCSHQRYDESLDNVTPANAYLGRAAIILKQRKRINRQPIELRRLQHRKLAA